MESLSQRHYRREERARLDGCHRRRCGARFPGRGRGCPEASGAEASRAAGMRSWMDSSQSIWERKSSPKVREAMVMTSSSEGRSPVSNSMEVTGLVRPQGTMRRKKSRSVVTLRAKPCEVTPREMCTPMAAILRSVQGVVGSAWIPNPVAPTFLLPRLSPQRTRREPGAPVFSVVRSVWGDGSSTLLPTFAK